MVTESGKANDGRNEAIKMLIGKMSFSDDDENHIHLSVLYTLVVAASIINLSAVDRIE